MEQLKVTITLTQADKADYKIGVLAGDVISKFDAGRIEKHNVPVVGLNTGKECHLDAHLVGHGIADLPLDDLDTPLSPASRRISRGCGSPPPRGSPAAESPPPRSAGTYSRPRA